MLNRGYVVVGTCCATNLQMAGVVVCADPLISERAIRAPRALPSLKMLCYHAECIFNTHIMRI
jgi:hypothetical protein